MTCKHRTKTALLLSLAALAAFALLAPTWPGARLAQATGSVEIGRGEPTVWKSADEGDALGAGDRVRTGEDGRAEIALDGSTLRLYPNSMLRLPESNTPGTTAVEMDRGTSLFDVLRRGDSFEVRTPEVVASVKGTRFGVGVGDDLSAQVAVYRGVVGVRGEAGQAASETLVHAGFAAFGSEQMQLRWHGSDDPWESWKSGDVPGSLERGARRGAALRDARAAATAMARDLPKQKGDAHRRGDRGDGKKDAPPAHIAEPLAGQTPGGVVRDVVADAGETLDQTLGETFVEEVVSDTTGGVVDLLVTVLDGSGRSGPDAVQLEDPATGDTWVLDKNDLKDIEKGTASLPSDLVSLLDDNPNQNQVALLNSLQRLLGR